MALFDFLKKKTAPKQEVKPAANPIDNVPGNIAGEEMVASQEINPIKMSVSISTRVVEDNTVQRTKGVLKLADIDGYTSPSGGFVNYARFYITGKHPETGHKKKKRYDTQSEVDARAMAIADGLLEPFTIEIEKLPAPTDRQLEYAKDLKATIPEGVCQYDVSAIISRITEDDELPPNSGLSRFAHAYGVCFSRFVGRDALLRYMVNQLKGARLATLYAYAVYLQEKGGSFGDPRVLPMYDDFVACGEFIEKDAGLLKSLEGRDVYDFRKPNRGTKIYKAVAGFLSLK